MQIDDQLLSAWLDHELDDQQQKAVGEAIRNDPSVAKRLAELTGANNIMVEHFSAIDRLPLPGAVSALLEGETQSSRIGKGAILSINPHRNRPVAQRYALPLAASIALLLGFGAGYGVAGLTGTTEGPMSLALGPVQRDSALDDLLANTESGATRALPGKQNLEMKLSFIARDGSPCRELELTSASQSVGAIACIDRDRQWHVRLASASDPETKTSDNYQAATSGEENGFGGAVDAMMAGDALTSAQERELIARKWINSRPN
ncbi:hypothetical protein FG91_01629 [Sphingopyxis sp. LC81]|uniref:anti-sigma factor family protein n=1 Tax=Sphingopyxis sp. LC81 TaxID=1502850 RepID=UPI00050FD3B4|nr:hypothetical protein [Sphingopyxis sp. LC81]KGB55000.1 hypothetical protein FG91_01629 [Sphingopyxis sp. LC81]